MDDGNGEGLPVFVPDDAAADDDDDDLPSDCVGGGVEVEAEVDDRRRRSALACNRLGGVENNGCSAFVSSPAVVVSGTSS